MSGRYGFNMSVFMVCFVFSLFSAEHDCDVVALRQAVLNARHTEIKKMLSDYGCGIITLTTPGGDTMLHYLPFSQEYEEQRGFFRIPQLNRQTTSNLLLSFVSRESINCCNRSGDTALHWASSWGKVNIVRCLLRHKARVNCCNQKGETPIHRAASNNSVIEVLRVLIAQGASVHDRDAHGRTPLIKAVVSGKSSAVVRYLLEHGADPSGCDKDKKTALDYANLYDQTSHSFRQSVREKIKVLLSRATIKRSR